jgi:hypothetical protein
MREIIIRFGNAFESFNGSTIPIIIFKQVLKYCVINKIVLIFVEFVGTPQPRIYILNE